MKIANAIQLEDLPKLGWLQSYWTKSWLRRHPVFVRTCRLFTQTPNARVLFRITVLAVRSDFSNAERKAEEIVSDLIQANALCSTKINEAQWRRGRLVTDQTLSSESEDVLRGICLLKRLKSREIVVYERLEQPEAIPSPDTANSPVSTTTDSQFV